MKVYQGKTIAALFKYLLSALVLVVSGAILLSVSTILGELLLIAAISIPVALTGRLLFDRNRIYSGILMKRLVAWLPIEFTLSLALYSEIYSMLGSFAATGTFFALFFFMVFVSLKYSASALLNRAPQVEVSRWLYKFSWSFLLFATYFLFFLLGEYYYAGYPFLFAGIGNIPFSIYPLLDISGNRQIRDLSAYIRDSSTKYITGFFLLGLTFSVLQIPKSYEANEFILFFLLLGTIVMVMFAFWRWYNIGTGRIESLYNTIYQAHRHTPKIVSEDQADIFANSVKDFVVRGQKGDLLITLSHLLGENGTEIGDSITILERLRDYGGKRTEISSTAFSAKSIENEIEMRVETVNSIAIVMRKVLEGKI